MNIRLKRALWALLLAMVAFNGFAATDPQQKLLDIQHRWATINYQVPKDQQADAFEALAQDINQALAASPERADWLVWKGIVLSTWAGAKGGLGALGLVKDAKRALEHAIELDGNVLAGSAYTSLGSLYYQVPGWPLGFGNDKKARQMLEQAITISPDGIDSNYFYADFLLDQKEYQKAKIYFEKALAAPAREQRSLADSGRRGEIQAKLNFIKKELL